ncbi:DHA2 family efflux MFS transporter permease subunit [Hyphobacterium sp. CCMP332]|nr:DHA2 family efflux MFS transporter permease subunit [Hyphobacterium sp. CCMP332]
MSIESGQKIEPRNEIWLLIATITASSMAMIDSTALNVALPALQKSLNISGAQLLWVVNSYLLFLSSLLLVGGSLGDYLGRKKIFMLGIGIFALSSIACGVSPNGLFLIIARAVQGIGGALMVPGSLTLIATLFPQEKKGRAIGTWSMFSALTTILGPVLGGVFANLGLWRWVFFINVPLGLMALWILSFKIPESKIRKKEGALDFSGALFITFSLGFATYGFIQASEWSFSNPIIIASLLLSVVFFSIFIVIEKRAKNPLMPLFLFRNNTFSALNFLTFLIYGGLGAVLFFLPLNIIQIQGYSEIIAGLGILPFGILISVLARISGKWVDKYGFKKLLIIGPLITAIGFAAFSIIGYIGNTMTFIYTFLPVLIICGIGMGLTVVPLTTGIMMSIKESHTGAASGINNTIARAASVIVLAIMGSLALIQFKKDFKSDMDLNSYTLEQREHLDKELLKFAEAKAPEIFNEEEKDRINLNIRESFLTIYKHVCLIGAFMPLIGAVFIYFYVRE